jgi:exodeoxyribonuclease VII large subunit
LDTLLLVRGGGSLEDLWAFNDERVVRAVVACAVPVVCGVGHETDITLADLAADLRAATPTAAAELAAPERLAALADLDAAQTRMQRALQRRVLHQAQQLDSLVQRLGQPARLVLLQGQRLNDREQRAARALRASCSLQHGVLRQLAQRLLRAAGARWQQERSRLAAAHATVAAHDPKRVLQRGYARIESASGTPVVSVQALQPGQQVRAVWADGHAQAQVLSVQARPDK